ncbi:hypothetical protein ILYODFUR_028826 [Ilyodon furcidens]|uniref:Uncharacterized protein n=1 Tax=Ilyodon furcidens TaxID=33524 RepID=A0ABV0TRA0_9TELE
MNVSESCSVYKNITWNLFSDRTCSCVSVILLVMVTPILIPLLFCNCFEFSGSKQHCTIRGTQSANQSIAVKHKTHAGKTDLHLVSGWKMIPRLLPLNMLPPNNTER